MAVLAALDAFGIAFTVSAFLVLMFRDDAPTEWWAVVGLAVLLSMVTTVLLVHLVSRRRAFIAGAIEITTRLERGREDRDLVPQSIPFMRSAFEIRDWALASGDLEVAARLDAALAPYRRWDPAGDVRF